MKMVFLPSFLDGLTRRKSEGGRESNQNDAVCSPGTLLSEKSNIVSAVCSKRGQKGINQDRAIVCKGFGCQEEMTFCGVFDGHGAWGHVIAKRVKRSFPASLLCHLQQTLSSSSFPECSCPLDIWKESYLKTFSAVDLDLKLHPSIDSYRSGCTALTALFQGNHLVIANAGDSRAVLASNSGFGKGLIAVQLSVDLKPNIPEEAERILQSDGRIFCQEDEPGVYRVRMPNRDSPGLAVSRAFGDYCLKDFGLISKPDVTYRKITDKDRFLILATDGLWDVMSNEEAVEIVASVSDKTKSAKRLVKRATWLWHKKRRYIAIDDISAICLFFHP